MLKWIVQRVRIPVQALRVAGIGYNRIRADKASQRGMVVARVVVVEANIVAS